MKLSLSLIACFVLAAGCKTDGADTTAGSAAPGAEPSAPRGRSGKIDLPRPRPRASDEERPALPDEARGSDDVDRRERRSESRMERMAELDKDGDGKISDEEREAGRKARLAGMKNRLDADGDGKLTVSELQASPMARRMGDISALDTDKNGEISAEELQKSLDEMRSRAWGGRRGGRGWGNPGGGAGSDGDPPRGGETPAP